MRKAKWKIYTHTLWRFKFIPEWRSNNLRWKDKYETPRCEKPPTKSIEWLWFGITIVQEDDDYWERWLWIHEYCDGDIKKAEETWGWVDCETKESTWKNFT